MIHSRQVVGNSRIAQSQWDEIRIWRDNFAANEARIMQGNAFAANDGLIPRDVYQEFDRIAVERFRLDDGDTFLNDLLPNSRPVNIGRLVHKYRMASDAGIVRTSMGGQSGVKMDKVDSTYDGTIIPIHDAGFSRGWREWNAQNAEMFDGLIDDQREVVASVRSHLADTFMDGVKDVNGNYIVEDALSWKGMRNDTRVAAVDIGSLGINFDFTLSTNTGEQIKAAFLQVRDVIRVTNKMAQPLTIYISYQIETNFSRAFSNYYAAPSILTELASLPGIAAIKTTNKLTGNQLMGFPLTGNLVRPVVGMGLTTVAMPRAKYNDDYEFVVWGAIGFEVRNDFSGATPAFYASALT